LHKYSSQDQVVVGMPIAGRSRLELEPLIGFFVNVLPICIDCSGNPTFLQVLEEVRTLCLGAYAHQDLPFEKLVSELGPERSTAVTPIFQVAFDFVNTPQERLHLGGLAVTQVESENSLAKYDISLVISTAPAEWQASLVYDTTLFAKATIERFIAS